MNKSANPLFMNLLCIFPLETLPDEAVQQRLAQRVCSYFKI